MNKETAMNDVITFCEMLLKNVAQLRLDFGPRKEFMAFEYRAHILQDLAKQGSILVGPFLKRTIRDLEDMQRRLLKEVREESMRLDMAIAHGRRDEVPN